MGRVPHFDGALPESGRYGKPHRLVLFGTGICLAVYAGPHGDCGRPMDGSATGVRALSFSGRIVDARRFDVWPFRRGRCLLPAAFYALHPQHRLLYADGGLGQLGRLLGIRQSPAGCGESVPVDSRIRHDRVHLHHDFD